MKKWIWLLVSFFACSITLHAQDSSRLRISLLTCGPGTELYSSFGHSAVRIVDSNTQQDVVYNYGTFNFDDPNFYSLFTRGKLMYYLNAESFRNFIDPYQYEKRSVYEQELALTFEEKNTIKKYLDSNAQEENKYYHYDFLFDNCSTRILDVFKKGLGRSFKPGHATTSDSLSFRARTDYYLRFNRWTRFGINLLLSTPVDKKMSNEESMFLPDFLKEGFRGATLNGKAMVSQTLELLPNKINFQETSNTPKIFLWLFAILIFLLSISIKHASKMLYFDVFFFMLVGLLGCIMLFMWFGTDHQSCQYNRNLMWALPTHLIFAFFIPKKKSWLQLYARISLGILLVALVWNLFAAQVYMEELTPVILLLLWRLNFYRKNRHQFNPYDQFRRIFSQFSQR